MNTKKLTKEEKVIQWLLDGSLYFTTLLKIYVGYLEHVKSENNKHITDLVYITAMYRDQKLNKGTKEKLEQRFKETIKAVNHEELI